MKFSFSKSFPKAHVQKPWQEHSFVGFSGYIAWRILVFGMRYLTFSIVIKFK